MRRWAFLIALVLLPSLAEAQSSAINSLSPPNTIAGATDMTLTVVGTGFVFGASINWNGAAQTTTFLSPTALTAIINTPLLATIGAAQVTVTQGGVTSSPAVFQILTPLVSGITYQPTSFTAGSAATITITGQGFNPTATVFFDWFPVTTTFVSSNLLSASVFGSQIVGNGPHHVAVYNAQLPAGLPSLNLQPLVGFGSLQTTTTGSQTITVTNISGASVTLASPFRTLSGANVGDFTASGGTCANGTVLAPAASCTATFTFTPSLLSHEIAAAAILSNGTGSPQYVTLNGAGTPPVAPAVTISPAGLLFGNQVQSTASSAITAMVTNSGTSNLTFSALSVTGTNSADFSLSGGSCTGSTTLTPGANCTLTVVFTPSGTNTESADVTITDNATGSPHTLALHGAGIAAPSHYVALVWTASTSSSLVGYNIYRGTQNGGPYTLLTPSPLNATSYNDNQVTHSTTYYYVITSVGTNPPYSPTESPNSSQVSATP